MKQEGWRLFVKTAIDRSLAAGVLLGTAPIIAAVAGVVRVKLGSPVLFKQTRPGKHGEPFVVHKFRTMTDERDARGELLPDAERLHALGRFLRSTSLDELPQLWNVLNGEMSIVGPRPLLMKYLPLYDREQARRHDVLPGITGWAQVNGRNSVSWEEKFAMDVWYVDHWSLLLDARIVLKTLATVATRRGVSGQDHVTMSEFKGSPRRDKVIAAVRSAG